MIAGILIAAFGAIAALVAVWTATVLVGPAPRRSAVSAPVLDDVAVLREEIAELRNANVAGTEETERLRLMILRLRVELNEKQRESVRRELDLARELASARRPDVADDRVAPMTRASAAA